MSEKVVAMWDAGERPKRGRGEPPSGGGNVPVNPALWESAPFTLLGKSGRKLHFFDASGQEVELAPSALMQFGDLLTLCGARHNWLFENFPARDKESGEAWFNVRGAAAAIIARSCELDVFDPNEPRHRYGLWPVPGGYALHVGRKVLWLGAEKTKWRDAGFRDAGALWPRLPGRPAPPDAVADAAAGRALEAMIASWNWESAHAPALMLGGAVVGMIGAVAPWRAHICVVGEPGCGKTTLLRALISALCPMTFYSNDYTEAGLRQMLSETAAGVVLDEAEADAGGETKLQKVIELLRRSSSGAGVESVKGGADHSAKTFTVSTSAILGCIWPPALTPQDESRITLLQMLPLAASGGEDGVSIAAFAERHGPALWGRAVQQAGRAVALFRLLRQRLLQRGCSPRLADQLGMLAAARWVMVAEADQDPASADPEDNADEPLEHVAHLIASDADRVVDSGPNLALHRLLATALDMQGDKLTIGQALARVRRAPAVLAAGLPPDANSAEYEEIVVAKQKAREALAKLPTLLAGHGLRWGRWPQTPPPGAPPPSEGLYVTVSDHPRLSRAFDNTPWANKRWGAALARLPDGKSSTEVGTVRLAGAKPRCCWLPAATLDDLIG